MGLGILLIKGSPRFITLDLGFDNKVAIEKKRIIADPR